MQNGTTLPPHSLSAETGVLSSVMLYPDVMGEIIDVLQADHFYRDSHGVIYACLRDLYLAGKTDSEGCSILMEEELRRRGQLEKVGGVDGILDIQASEVMHVNARYYAQVVLEASIGRGLIEVGTQIVRDGYSGTLDAYEKMARAQTATFRVGDDCGCEQRSISDLAAGVISRYEAREQDRSLGLMSGIEELDLKTLGFRGGDLIILGARPSMGKTALALAICSYVAMNGDNPGHIYFASLEMGGESLADRLAVTLAPVDAQQFKGATLDARGFDLVERAVDRLASAPITIDDRGTQTADSIAAAARRANAKSRLSLIVVDYIQLMQGGEDDNEGRQSQVAAIPRRLENLTRDLDVPVLALSQLNRKVEEPQDKRPSLSDLCDSRAIEQDADIVLLMFRPGYYDASDRSQKVELDVAKQRNGPTGRVELAFIKERVRAVSGVQGLPRSDVGILNGDRWTAKGLTPMNIRLQLIQAAKRMIEMGDDDEIPLDVKLDRSRKLITDISRQVPEKDRSPRADRFPGHLSPNSRPY